MVPNWNVLECNIVTQCNELCNIARYLNSTVISDFITLTKTDVPSKYVWQIIENCNISTTIPYMLWVRVMPKFRIAKEKEKQWGHFKKAATKRLIFFDKSLSEKNVILNISEFPVPK